VWRLALQIGVGLAAFAVSVNCVAWLRPLGAALAPLLARCGLPADLVSAAVAEGAPSLPFWLRAAAALLFGIFQVMPLLHAMHDSSHTAIGPHEGWWKAIGRLTHDWYVGGSMMSWHHQHIVGHHVYTNVFLADPDIPYRADGDVRRIVAPQSWAAVYRWQWLYLPLLYSVLALKVRVSDVTDTWLARTSGPMRVNFYDSAFVRIFLVKLSWLSWRVALPLFAAGLKEHNAPGTFFALFMITELMSGVWLAWNFEVSHLVPEALFPVVVGADEHRSAQLAAAAKGTAGALAKANVRYAEGQLVVPQSWVVAQVESSLDYAHDAPLTTWWCGALNYQIEHHLFPGVSQYHYPAIAPIVKRICEARGVRYNYAPTFVEAWTRHVHMLYEMGQKGFSYKWD
jgi:fatty acid desaturase